MMEKIAQTGVLLLILPALVIGAGCESNTGSANADTASAEKRGTQKKKIMNININMEHQEKAQLAADKGFQPWRNNPVDVAEESIISLGIGSTKGKSVLLSESEKEASVRVESNSGIYQVGLKRLVRPDGIWTSTKIEKESQ